MATNGIPAEVRDRQESMAWTPYGNNGELPTETVKDVCNVTKLSVSTVKSYVYQGILPAYKPGVSQELRFKRSDIAKLFRRVRPREVVVEPEDTNHADANMVDEKDIRATPVEVVEDVRPNRKDKADASVG